MLHPSTTFYIQNYFIIVSWVQRSMKSLGLAKRGILQRGKVIMQTTTCVTEDAKHSTLFYRTNPFNSSLETKDLGCGVLGIWCHTCGSLRRVLPDIGWRVCYQKGPPVYLFERIMQAHPPPTHNKSHFNYILGEALLSWHITYAGDLQNKGLQAIWHTGGRVRGIPVATGHSGMFLLSHLLLFTMASLVQAGISADQSR